MRKTILLFGLFVIQINFGQNVFPSIGNVGIGTINPLNSLDVNGDIQISNSLIPMGLITEVSGGYTPLLNMSLNFREPNKNLQYIGAGFRIDSRGGLPLFQWLQREPGTETEQVFMSISRNGNVGIGTTAPDEKLTVKGKIHTQEVRVDMLGPLVPDYVFANDYPLKPLHEVEDYIKQNSHLPEIPSAKEIEENGLMLAEMNMALLKKIEELTLYAIEQNKRLDNIESENKELKNKMKLIEKKND